MTVKALKKNNMERRAQGSGYKMQSPLRKDEKKKESFDDKNRVMTTEEKKKLKIKEKENTTYYINKKTGQMSTGTTINE